MKDFLRRHLWARVVGTVCIVIFLPIWLPLATIFFVAALLHDSIWYRL